MARNPLITYLETYRLRTGLTRSELAFLLGAMDTKNVAAHERGTRIPLLRTALGYSLVLGASAEDLYEGLVADIRESLKHRARGLCGYIKKKPRSKKNDLKIQVLLRLTGDDSSQPA